MKTVLIRLAKYTGLVLVLVFVAAFAWANWTPLSAGEKAPPVLFYQYDVADIQDTVVKIKIETALNNMKAVSASTYNRESNIISAGIRTDLSTTELVEASIKKQLGIKLKHTHFKNDGPRCPMAGSLTFASRMKRLLSVRD